MKIIIDPYNPNWKIDFFRESEMLQEAIDEINVSIEHIGSTSVEGLGAKPVIDIMVGLEDFRTADNYIKAIETLGYKYISEYENVMPYRRFFTKNSNGNRTHHIHIVEIDTEFWNRHLKFRNQLRNNTKLRDEYHKLKLELAKKEWEDGNKYATAKSDFIKEVERLK